MKFELTPDQSQLLCNILSEDCSYLETATDDEFQTYLQLRENLGL